MCYKIADFYLLISEEPSAWRTAMVEYLDRQCPVLKWHGEILCNSNTVEFKHYNFNFGKLNIINHSPREHLITDDGIYINLETKIAFKLGKKKMTIWVERPNFILTFLLQLFFIQHNYIFSHGAGFRINGRNIFISALGGIGKTALTSKILSKNNNLLYGDDFVLLDENGFISPFPQTLCLYKYHKRYYLDFFKEKNLVFNYSESKGLYGKIKRRIMKYARCDMLPYKVYSPDIVFGRDKIASSPGKCENLFLMKKSSVSELTIGKIEKEKFINYLTIISYNEWNRNIKLLFGYCCMQEHSIEDYFNRVRKIATNFVENCFQKDIVQIEVPTVEGDNRDVYEEIYMHLSNIK